MARHKDNLEAISLLGFGIGIYTFFKGFRDFRKYRVVADTPEIPVRSIPMGFVQIQGQAKGEEQVTSPVSHTSCFWYQVSIEHWKSDSKGGGHWAHFRTDADGVKFYLADGTGRVLVDARDAEFDLPQTVRREVGHGGAVSAGTGATDQELLQYVTKAGVHWLGGLVGRGLNSVGPLADPAKEEKRQALAEAFQFTPGTPEFMRRMMTMTAPMIKQRIESAGPQADPQHEQARQAMLQALNHPPGSPEFLEAVRRAEAVAGPAGVAPRFDMIMQSVAQGQGAELAMFNAATGRYRFTEFCLVPDGTYDITGTCKENPNPRDEHDRNLIAKGQNEPTFLISSKTEKQLESALRRRAAGKIFGGAALALVCAAIFLAKLGWLF